MIAANRVIVAAIGKIDDAGTPPAPPAKPSKKPTPKKRAPIQVDPNYKKAMMK